MKKAFLEFIKKLPLVSKSDSLFLPCFYFNLSVNGNSDSGIGGIPILPEHKFPEFNNERLSFLININLNEIDSINSSLPNLGSLLFFIYTGDLGYRFPCKKNEFKVVYIQDESLSFSVGSSPRYHLEFYEYISFPSYQESLLETIGIKDKELGELDAFSIRMNNDYDINHQILGHPTAVQGTVRFWWSLYYLGYKMEDLQNLTTSDNARIKNEEANFVLLLQLNFADTRIGIDYFGDSVAYFGIHKNDLNNLNFDNAVLVMQNT